MRRAELLFAGVLVLAVLAPAASAADEGAAAMENLRTRLAAGQETRIVCFGDSITGAYYHTGGVRAWCDMLGVALGKLYPGAQVEMINAGISGHTTENALARIEKDVLARRPHLVVVMFGMNDVARLSLDAFQANLREIVRQCQAVGAAVLLSTPNTVHENAARPNAALERLSQKTRDLAAELSLPLADCFADYARRRADDETAWMLLMSDDIHPNMHGHRCFAELIAATIAGRQVDLSDTPPPDDALRHTLALLERGEPIRLVAMPPYDVWFPELLKEHYPQAKIEVIGWPTGDGSVKEMSRWAAGIRDKKPDLVVPAVPGDASAANPAEWIANYEWVLNYSFPFEGRAWDCAPALPCVAGRETADSNGYYSLAESIIRGKDAMYLKRAPGDDRDGREIVRSWIAQQKQALAAKKNSP